MDRDQMRLIVWLVYFSVAALFIPAIYYTVRWITNRTSCENCKKTGISKVLTFSGWLLVAVWCLRYAVGYFTVVTACCGTDTLTWWEEIFNSLVHTLQTFSMDEDYTAYILDGKQMMAQVFGEHTWYPTAYGIYASVLNFTAPVAGGAIVFEMLASIFPKLRLWGAYWLFFRKKYFFSELNTASLALAKDICAVRKAQWPVLIFTDAYTEDGNEKDHELMLEAQQYGAICLRDDLVHVKKPWWGKQEYYLMDELEFGNLQTLMELTNEAHVDGLKDSNIYLFVQSDAYVQIEKQVRAKLEPKEGEKPGKAKKRPNIIPVNGYRNLVQNLLTQVPLYEPLVGKADPENLTVTVFGNGTIGTEAFLNIYWFGQLLVSKEDAIQQCRLTVNVVSKDTPEEFWAKIDYVNPEIRQTVQILEGTSCQTSGQFLRYDDAGHKSSPYCAVRYVQADIKIGGFVDGHTLDAKAVLGADYFIVALGNDADNISVAQSLRRSVGKTQLETAGKNIVVAYAVFNEDLANTLNEQKRYRLRNQENADLYMHAFGSLEQVYSCDNVYMSQHALWAEETGSAYSRNLHTGSHLSDHRKRAKDEDSDYKYWANLARAAHIKYKVFSLGWIEESVFTQDDEAHNQYIRQCCRKYKAVAVTEPDESKETLYALKQQIEAKKHCLAWLEHRRWNAFTRTLGYRYVPARTLYAAKGSQKDMPLKLHSCLVEAKWPGKEEVYMTPATEAAPYGHRDYLDDTSWIRLAYTQKAWEEAEKRGEKPEKTLPDDFKKYDYYTHEFDAYYTQDQLKALLAVDEKTVCRLCCDGCFAGAEYFEEEKLWLIPQTAAQTQLQKIKEGKVCTFRNLWIRLVLNCRKKF